MILEGDGDLDYVDQYGSMTVLCQVGIRGQTKENAMANQLLLLFEIRIAVQSVLVESEQAAGFFVPDFPIA